MSAFTDHRQTVFEVELHNQAVRECVKENRSHELFDDRWADVQTHEVAASDEHKALGHDRKQLSVQRRFRCRSRQTPGLITLSGQKITSHEFS